MTEEDIDQVNQLEKNCGLITTNKRSGILTVATTTDNQIIGFLVLRLFSYDSTLGYIASLGIDPLYRKKNIGMDLWEYSMSKFIASGGTKVFCHTKQNNIAIRKMAKNVGAIEVKGTKNFPKDDTLILLLTFR